MTRKSSRRGNGRIIAACQMNSNRISAPTDWGKANRQWGPPGGAAYTLIEILVVIAVIAILAALLLPGLCRSKQQAIRIACLNNRRQSQICSHLYALDHADRLPPNNFVYDIATGNVIPGFSTNMTWCPGLAPYETTPVTLEHGLLF